jgi:hypothetical protein
MLDARLHLLDRQLLDADGTPVGIVDDLDVDGVDAGADIAAGAAPGRITGISTGRVMMTRLLGGRQPPAHQQIGGPTEGIIKLSENACGAVDVNGVGGER